MYCLKLLFYCTCTYYLFGYQSGSKKKFEDFIFAYFAFLLHVLCIHLFSIVSILLQIKKFIDSRAGSNVPKVHVMQLHLDYMYEV